MRPGHGRTMALGTAALALVVALVAARGRISEEYWVWRLRHGNQAEKVLAIKRLGAAGSARAARELVRLFPIDPPDSDQSKALIIALRAIGRPAVPALHKILMDEEYGVRRRAAIVLMGIKPSVEDVPALVGVLQGCPDDVAGNACDLLGKVGPEAKAAVPALVAALSCVRRSVRFRAAVALGRIGPGAEAAVPALLEAEKESILVRDAATEAVRSIRGETAP